MKNNIWFRFFNCFVNFKILISALKSFSKNLESFKLSKKLGLEVGFKAIQTLAPK